MDQEPEHVVERLALTEAVERRESARRCDSIASADTGRGNLGTSKYRPAVWTGGSPPTQPLHSLIVYAEQGPCLHMPVREDVR